DRRLDRSAQSLPQRLQHQQVLKLGLATRAVDEVPFEGGDLLGRQLAVGEGVQLVARDRVHAGSSPPTRSVSMSLSSTRARTSRAATPSRSIPSRTAISSYDSVCSACSWNTTRRSGGSAATVAVKSCW